MPDSAHHSPAFSWLEKVLWIFAVVLGLLFVFIIPPFQKADEPTHFYKAVSVASGHLLCAKNAEGTFQNHLPQYLVQFPKKMLAMHIASNANAVFPRSFYWSTITAPYDHQSTTNEPSSCSLPSLLYLPLGLVLSIPVLLRLNPLLIFYLGRLSQFGFSLLVFYWACRVVPKKLKILPVFILSLPMVLYQVSSFSKDALHLSFGVLAVCTLFKMIEKKKAATPTVMTFLISLGISIFARPQYVSLSLLAFLVPKNQSHKKVKSLLLPFLFVAITIFGIFFGLSLETYSAKASSLGNDTPNVFVHPDIQFQYLRENIIALPSLFSQTIEQNQNFFLQSAVGMLGWLEFSLPWYVYAFYLGLGGYIFFGLYSEFPRLKPFAFVILTTAVLGTVGAIFISFYFYATPVAATSIQGIQGRYFLLLLPLFFWLLGILLQYSRKKLFC